MRRKPTWVIAVAFTVASCSVANTGLSPAVTTDAVDSSGAELASADSAVDSTADAAEADPWANAPPEQCRSGAAWDGSSPIFEDITDAAGLKALKVAGIRISTADLDGDHRPELFVRSMAGTGKREVFDGTAPRRLFLLRAKATESGFAFEDITASSGVLATRDGGSGRQVHTAVFGDANNDGHVDLFAGASVPSDKAKDGFPGDASELLLGDGKGQFTLTAQPQFATTVLRRSLTAASWVDFDKDGMLDLWLGYGSWPGPGGDMPIPDQLLRGGGQGAMELASAAEGVTTLDWLKMSDVQAGTVHRNTWGTAACDVNGDGWPDLLSVSYGRYFNALWLGGTLGDTGKRYAEVSAEGGFDRDSDDDWTTNWNAQCYCAENPTAADCSTSPKPVVNCPALKKAFGGTYRWNHATDRQPWRLGGNTGTVACADLDRDGDLDMVYGSIVHPDVGPSSDPLRVALNDGQSPMPHLQHLKGSQSGLQHTFAPGQEDDVGDMHLAVLDFDSDGRLDILVASSDYPGTRAKLFWQQADGTYKEVTEISGLHQPHAHGIAVADWDLDGDLDVVLGHSRARCNLSPKECYASEEVHAFRNKLAKNSNFVRIRLVGGAGSNRSAIGARVKVRVAGSAGLKAVTHMQELGGGYGHFGLQQGLDLFFGLGPACQIEAVEVRWPDAAGTTEIWTHVRANQLVELRQGDTKPLYPLYKP